MGTPIAPSDLTWLLMDRPNNLMHIHGLMVLESPPDWEELTAAIFDRVISRYRVLSQIPVHRNRRWEWEDDPTFDVGRHLRRVSLEPGEEALRTYLAQRHSVPFDRSRPLWEMTLVTSSDGSCGLVSTFHHGLGDGVRMVQLLLGMCEHDESALPGAVGRGGATRGPLTTLLRAAEQSARDAADYVQHAGAALAGLGQRALTTHNPLALPHVLEGAVGLAIHPVKLIDAVTSVASEDNQWSNSWRELGRMLLSEPMATSAWSGHPGRDKAVAWVDGIDLARVKEIARRQSATVNDVLLSTISLALTQYLADRGEDHLDEVGWLMPVSLQPIDATLPDRLGNHFAVVLLPMPLGITDPSELLSQMRSRTQRIKNSAEPVLAFGLQRVVAEAPSAVAEQLTGFFSRKAVGQLTNVPGPASPLTLVGAPVRSVMGWVPTTGDQPLGICLFSYAGQVSVSIASDARMIPDPTAITALVPPCLDRLSGGLDAD